MNKWIREGIVGIKILWMNNKLSFFFVCNTEFNCMSQFRFHVLGANIVQSVERWPVDGLEGFEPVTIWLRASNPRPLGLRASNPSRSIF